MIIIKPDNWKKSEVAALLFVYAILIFNALFFKDAPAAVFSAFFGITYTVYAGKGKPVCYLFGLAGSFFYCYLSFCNSLWGNLVLYAVYYIPMQILGFFKWNLHLKTGENEIIKTRISPKERIILSAGALILILCLAIVLFKLQDTNPVIDAITTILSIAGMYLTVKRAVEQWAVWMIVNGLSVIMWGMIALKGAMVYSTVVMWSVYFILAVYFYREWMKEIEDAEKPKK